MYKDRNPSDSELILGTVFVVCIFISIGLLGDQTGHKVATWNESLAASAVPATSAQGATTNPQSCLVDAEYNSNTSNGKDYKCLPGCTYTVQIGFGAQLSVVPAGKPVQGKTPPGLVYYEPLIGSKKGPIQCGENQSIASTAQGGWNDLNSRAFSYAGAAPAATAGTQVGQPTNLVPWSTSVDKPLSGIVTQTYTGGEGTWEVTYYNPTASPGDLGYQGSMPSTGGGTSYGGTSGPSAEYGGSYEVPGPPPPKPTPPYMYCTEGGCDAVNFGTVNPYGGSAFEGQETQTYAPPTGSAFEGENPTLKPAVSAYEGQTNLNTGEVMTPSNSYSGGSGGSAFEGPNVDVNVPIENRQAAESSVYESVPADRGEAESSVYTSSMQGSWVCASGKVSGTKCSVVPTCTEQDRIYYPFKAIVGMCTW